MNSRAFGAQSKMSQYPDILDFTPTAHPLNSSLHGQFSQRPESTPPTPGLWGAASANPVDNGVAPILSLEKDFCSNFTCCGLALADMHQLLDHFEESHVVVLGDDGQPIIPQLACATINNPSAPAFASAPRNALAAGGPAGWTSMAVGYPQPFPPADASFAYPQPSAPGLIDTNFLLPTTSCSPSAAQQQPFPDLDLDLDMDFMTPLQQEQQPAGVFDPFRLDFDLDSLSTRPSSPSASSTFSTPSLTWSDASSSFGALPAFGAGASASQPGSGHSSPGYASPLAGGDVEAMCLPPALLTIRPQTGSASTSAVSSAMPSARSSPCPEPLVAPQRPRQQQQQQQRKESHSDVEESREKEKRTTVGKIKAKIFGSARGERKPKSDGYSKKRDPRREKAYKCPRPGCIKSYLNPNGLKYHLEKGTCIIDPLYRAPAQDAQAPTTTTLAAKRASSQPAGLKDSSIPEPLTSLPTPLLPVKSEPASPPLGALDMRQGQQGQAQAQAQQGRGPFYYAYTFPFQYGTAAQVPSQ